MSNLLKWLAALLPLPGLQQAARVKAVAKAVVQAVVKALVKVVQEVRVVVQEVRLVQSAWAR